MIEAKPCEEELEELKNDLERTQGFLRDQQTIITKQARFDPLTGLPNRSLFHERFDHALYLARRHDQKVALMFLDLDHFKMINDSLGHAVGDELLKEVAAALQDLLRKSDTVARLGGDEFVILIPDVEDVNKLAIVANKVVEAMRQPWKIFEHNFTISSSLGVSVYPNDGEDAETLIKHADIAMYQAKEQGRDGYMFFTKAMNEKLHSDMKLAQDMRASIEDQGFKLFYQPKINTMTRKIVGAEALIRWVHPEDGMISPGTFIPVAENTGLIIALGEWILEEACKQQVSWKEKGLLDIQVAVNLSVRQFEHYNLLDMVTQTVERTGINPEKLELEVTESLAVKNMEKNVSTLDDIKKLGIEIAMDDFGTGYSSLSYLKQLPIDTLKIDQAFVRDLPDDNDSAILVNTIIQMGQGFGLNIIAEGVESEEHYQFLLEHNCTQLQGYLFSKPLPAEEFEVLLKKEVL
jgi:diguanylate cyclase (GGDEF)-like protein